jgi:phospholipid/cholesterol/gamma-HCH transport system substrate-binding protein
MNRGRVVLATAMGIALLALAGVVALLVTRSGDRHVVAYFPNTTGLYAGDEVRILGVPVGAVDKITPDGDQVRVELHYDADQSVPANATAVIVAPTLVTSRYIQLTPRWTGGPVLAESAVIPRQRTVVPVEWDEVQKQLMRVTTALGPQGADRDGALSRAINTTSKTLGGTGRDINAAIQGLTNASELLSDSRGDLFGTVRNLQVFVSALVTSDQQIVEFDQRLASVSDTLSDNRRQLGDALTQLRDVVDTVQQFVKDNRDQLSTTVANLGGVTKIVADKQDDLAQVLHVAPTPLVDLYNAISPLANALVGQLAVGNFANPAQAICSGIAAASSSDPRQAGVMCTEYLNPVLGQLAMNYPPVMVDPVKREGGQTVPASPGGRNSNGGGR